MSNFLGNPFSQYMPTGSQANSTPGAPLSLFELMTGKSPDAGSAGQVPSGPGNPNQGANWMPPAGGMGSPQSQAMPNQGQGMGKNPGPQSGPGGMGGGWIPQMPGAGPGAGGGSTLFGQNGVMNGGQAGANSIMGKMGAKGGAVGG